jgi:ethanolamine utilization protein EutM
MSDQCCSLGIIETKGLSPALEAADTMLKLGQVQLVGIYFLGGSQVAVVVRGMMGPVQAAIEAGVASAERKGEVLSRNAIPHCDEDLVKYLNRLAPGLQPAI